jgi:hypothetical protein
MAKNKSTSGKATRATKSQPIVNDPIVNDPIVNDPANIPSATAVEQKVNPSVQVAASTRASEPQVASDPVKAESTTKTDKTDGAVNVNKPTEAGNDTDKSTKPESNNKMFELRKTEPRKNVVPINLEEEIRRRAYELSQQHQPGTGSEADDWLTAEREVMQRYHQQSA